MTDRRGQFREGLHELYLPYYDRLCETLPDHWQPTEGYRTFERQQMLYDSGRTKPGPIVTRALPGQSLHNWGLASDWAHFDGIAYTPITASDSRWHEYIDACTTIGLKCIVWDKPHNEYKFKKITLFQLYDKWRIEGMGAAMKFLKGEENAD